MYTRGASQTVTGAYDADGSFFPLDSCQQVINKDASTGNVTSIVATFGGFTWTQTFTYTDTKTTISQWIKG